MNIRQRVTANLIRAIETGRAPWNNCWSSGCLHHNATSGAIYKGINQIILGMQDEVDPRWLTHRQAEDKGLLARKGANSTQLVETTEVDYKHVAQFDADVISQSGSRALIMQTFTVVNASQIDGMDAMPVPHHTINSADAIDEIIFSLQRTGLKINFGQGFHQAYYPGTDQVRIAPSREFESLGDFYATLLHEAGGHATGHPKRLGRFQSDDRLSRPARAREELCAVLVSGMLRCVLGLPPGPTMSARHASYIATWMALLKNDTNEIFRAATDAYDAFEYVMKLTKDGDRILGLTETGC